jgi:hypothetical protein
MGVTNPVNCISAAPAALDRYLAALPAMSRFPNAPFCLEPEIELCRGADADMSM